MEVSSSAAGEPAAKTKDAVFTVTVADPLTNELETYLDHRGMGQLSAEAGYEEGLNELLDQSLWESFLRTAKETLRSNRAKAAVMMGYGTTFNSKFRGENIYGHAHDTPANKTHVRIGTCISMRRLQLITFILAHLYLGYYLFLTSIT